MPYLGAKNLFEHSEVGHALISDDLNRCYEGAARARSKNRRAAPLSRWDETYPSITSYSSAAQYTYREQPTNLT